VDAADAAVSWIAVTGTNPTYTITALPIDEALIGSSHPYQLKIKFADAKYPNPEKKMPITTTIAAATCNCDLLTWDTPTKLTDTIDVASGPKTINLPALTMNAASKLPTPEIRKCFNGGSNCANTVAYVPTITAPANSAGALPDFVVQTGTTNALVVTPVAADDMGAWTI
jgi:hypothetical protein